MCVKRLKIKGINFCICDLQGAAACLARQLPSTGGTCDHKDEARTGGHCRDELPDGVGRGKQLQWLRSQRCRTDDSGGHDGFVQRQWSALPLDAHARHEHRRSEARWGTFHLNFRIKQNSRHSFNLMIPLTASKTCRQISIDNVSKLLS